MVQTANQRKANEKFAKLQEKKMGKPEAAAVVKPKKRTTKSKISGGWLILLAFAVFGGLLFEFVRLIWSRYF